MNEGLLAACHVPAVADLHPLAVDTVARWASGVATDLELKYVTALVNSTYLEWAECLVKLKESVGL